MSSWILYEFPCMVMNMGDHSTPCFALTAAKCLFNTWKFPILQFAKVFESRGSNKVDHLPGADLTRLRRQIILLSDLYQDSSLTLFDLPKLGEPCPEDIRWKMIFTGGQDQRTLAMTLNEILRSGQDTLDS